MFERFRRRAARPEPKPIYLVSAAGLPNYGDEFLTRVWLDWLAHNHPDVPVWLDCPEPGRANHLFRDTHPALKTTNTLWHLAFGAAEMTFSDGVARADRVVRELGSPRFDLGLIELRGMASIHLLGGGYMNTVWQNHLLLLPALVALKEEFGIPIYATGQGLLPLSDELKEQVRAWVPAFDVFETRDVSSATAVGAFAGIDDAFLGFANARKIYAEAEDGAPAEEIPDTVLVLQGDFLSADAATRVFDTVESFVLTYGRGERVALIESIPPDDSWSAWGLRERGIEVEQYPFLKLWQGGFPARPGQVWLSTRFHFHLLAAAAGAEGTAVSLRPDYYGVKHGSLADVGTGWTLGEVNSSIEDLAPAVAPTFPARRIELTAQKVDLAARLYGDALRRD